MPLPLLRHVVPLNDGNCRLTIPVVKGRCARDALLHAFHIGLFKFVKMISTIVKILTKNLPTYLKVVMLLLTAMIAGISNKRCQWLPLRVWWHAPTLVTHEISWHRAYVSWSSPLLRENWCNFPPKSTQSCYNMYPNTSVHLFRENVIFSWRRSVCQGKGRRYIYLKWSIHNMLIVLTGNILNENDYDWISPPNH